MNGNNTGKRNWASKAISISRSKRSKYHKPQLLNVTNKLCALSRLEPKDIADILFIAKRYPFNWEDIFKEAREKDLWVEPLEICKIIKNFPVELFRSIKWNTAVNTDVMKDNLAKMHDDIFYGDMNSLSKEEE